MAKQDKPNSGRPGPNKGSFADQLKSLQGSAEPAAKPAVKPAAMPLASRTIQDPKRAGRAPYNFVPPLDEQWCQVEPPPPLDQEHPDLLSGVIELDYEALTRFYLRGMYTLEKGPGAKPPTEPFLIDKQLRLPGPSLRGMLRTLVEIIGKAPLDPVNNDLLFFRAIASTGGESNSPEARAYKEQLGTELSNVKAGFLYGNANPRSWYIQPAQKLPGGEKWARLFTDETWKRGEAHFRCVPGKYGLRGVLCSPSDPGAIHGWKVCSGPPPPLPSHKKRYYSNGEEDKRRHQWLIPSEDKQAQKVTIPLDDVIAYREAGSTPAVKSGRLHYTESTKGQPCFYREWTDSNNERRVTFGHTPWFRIPYQNRTASRIPESMRRNDRKPWDLAQAIFGRLENQTEKIEGSRSRVAVEDAFAVPGASYDTSPKSIVLGSPKLTTYQHYLIQPSESPNQAVSWDGSYHKDKTVSLRGHKLYWHRDGAPPPPENSSEKVETIIQPCNAKALFTGRIRFENLRGYELGALLAALDLPPQCAHKLGMAKPLGYGSFRITVRSLRITHLDLRDAAIFAPIANGEWQWNTGQELKAHKDFISCFAKKFYGGSADTMWNDPRLSHLEALLRYRNLPANWLNRTRYLEFGKLDPPIGNYNEYKQVGWQSRRERQERRPLPPATQVVNPAVNLPDDPRPNFRPTRRQR